jgi:hypothetical protein
VPRSSIAKLDPKIRAELDRILKDGRHTIDEIVAQLRPLGAEVSRSAVGRYHKRFEELGKRMRESREVAQVWADKLGNAPQGDVGKLVMELLRTLAFDATMELTEPGEDGEKPQLNPKAINTLALAMQRLEAAGKWNIQREQAMREALADEVAGKLASGAGGAPRKLDKETLEFVRTAIRGE